MQGRLTTSIAAMAVLVMMLAGCADDTQSIARDACGLMEDIADDPTAFDEDVFAELQELQERADDADISDEEMQAAIQDECPEVFGALNGMDF